MKTIDVSLILACFNEGSSLTNSLGKITEVLSTTKYSWEIIAIDDNSNDLTFLRLKKFSQNKTNFSVFKNPTNIGRGGTVIIGTQKAKGNIAGFIDVDLEVSPIYIPQFVMAIQKGSDLAIATRIYKESLASLNRWMLSKGYSLLVKQLLNLNIKDTEAGYKFFNLKKFRPVLEQTRDKKWFFDTEIVALAAIKKLKITEIPVLFLRRDDKKSTVRMLPDILGYLKAIYKFKKQ